MKLKILTFFTVCSLFLAGCSYGIEDNSSLDASEVNSSLVNEDLAIPYEESALLLSSQESRLLNNTTLYEADNYIVYSHVGDKPGDYYLYLYNKKTGESKRLIGENSEMITTFSVRGNTIVGEFLEGSYYNNVYRVINLDNYGNVISVSTLPFTSKNCFDYTIYNDSVYYVRWYNMGNPNETYEFLRCDLSGENEEIIRDGVKRFGIYDDGFYLLEEHAILKFDPATNAVSNFYENKNESLLDGGFKDNGFFEYNIFLDYDGFNIEPGANTIDLKTGKHYDIIPSFADEWWKTEVFGRDDENFYFYMEDLFEGHGMDYTVYSYSIATGEIKVHKEMSSGLNLKNYKGETLENEDRTARFVSSYGTKAYYIYDKDIYFEDLVEN